MRKRRLERPPRLHLTFPRFHSLLFIQSLSLLNKLNMNNRHKLAATLCALISVASLHLHAQQSANSDNKFFDGANDPASQQVMRQAEADIEKYRKGDFTVTIEFADATQSRPIENRKSKIENSITLDLIRHQFNFGCSMFRLSKLPDGDPMKKAALQAILDLFNQVVTVDLWWDPFREPDDCQPAKDIAWAGANHLRMRYHAIFYEETREALGKNFTTEQYWQLFDKRIQYVASIPGLKTQTCDVINEPISRKYWFGHNPESFYRKEPAYPDLSKPAEIVRAFALARKYLPHAKLTALENGNPNTTDKSYKEIIAMWKAALAAGADIDHIGTQCHFFDDGQSFKPDERAKNKNTFTMAEISKALDMQKVLGKPIEVTEFTGPSRNKQKDEEYNRRVWTMNEAEVAAWQINFYKLVFSKPHIIGLARWNLIDRWCGRAADGGILTEKGGKTQVYHDLRKLIKETWHTRVTQSPGNSGAITFRGFYGDYQVTAPGYAPAEITLTPETKNIKVILRKI